MPAPCSAWRLQELRQLMAVHGGSFQNYFERDVGEQGARQSMQLFAPAAPGAWARRAHAWLAFDF